MSTLERVTFSLFGPLIPHASLLIDCNTQDIVKAITSPLLTYKLQSLSIQPYDVNTVCYGCRVRQMYGQSDKRTDIDDLVKRIQKESLITPSSASTADLHWHIIRLWARSWVSRSSPVPLTYTSTPELDQHPLCTACAPAMLSISAPLVPPHTYNVVTGLSVRSLLDAYLTHHRFPKGSIVLITAINIPDMLRVIRAHGLIPLPVDIDLGTTACHLDDLEATIQHYGVYSSQDSTGLTSVEPSSSANSASSISTSTSTSTSTSSDSGGGRICAFLTSYVFGIRTDLQPYFALTRRYHIPVIEDAAEAFTNPHFTGHPDSDLSLFSFGSIKYATAFGGGIARVKDWATYEAMIAHISSQPRHTNKQYFEKVKKLLPVSIALNSPLVAASIVRSSRLIGVDHKAYAVSMLRGFPGDMISGIRHQPSPALLYMLRHRLAHETVERLDQSRIKGAFLEECLTCCNVDADIVGQHAPLRSYWLFPILVRRADDAVAQLESYGVDVYRGATQLSCLPLPNELTLFTSSSPTGVAFPRPVSNAQSLMKHILYLPIHKNTPNRDIKRVVDALLAVCGPKQGPVVPLPGDSQVIDNSASSSLPHVYARL